MSNKNSPLISVYIANFNYGRYIRQAIESVLNQTLQDFELIIIDDGSTDNSRDVIESYRLHPKVKIIYQQNKGLNITSNIAMRASSGKYLIRLDADDYLENNALSVMSSTLESNPEIGMVFPDFYYINAEGARIGLEKRYDFDKEVSLYDHPAHGACTMIRLEFLKKLGGYDESFICQDGYDLWIKFINYYKVTNINEPLFSYRAHSGSLTSNEDMIIKTRKQIKELFVRKNLTIPETLAVIPVRDTYINNINLPFLKFNGYTLLEHKVLTCLQANSLSCIAVTSSDKRILNLCSEKFSSNNRVVVIERSKELEGPDKTLAKTIENALSFLRARGSSFQAVMSVAIEYPFITFDTIDEIINTLVLFKADSVLSVRSSRRAFYRYTGHGLKSILERDQFIQLERESLYEGSGGIVLSTVGNFIENNKLASGRISHVLIDAKSSFGIFNHFDLEVITKLTSDSH